MALEVGTRRGHYSVTALIGEGGLDVPLPPPPRPPPPAATAPTRRNLEAPSGRLRVVWLSNLKSFMHEARAFDQSPSLTTDPLTTVCAL
jgi:hypothetical protein